MLCAADADLVRRDLALPGLATLFEPEAFAAALNTAAPGADVKPGPITYLRYKPGMSCLAGYRLDAAAGPLMIYGQAYRPGAQDKFRKVRERPGTPGPLGSGRFVLESHAITVSVFPNDPALKALGRLADPEARTRLLRKLISDRPDLWDSHLEVLRYKPERRYVARLRGKAGSVALLKAHAEPGYSAARNSAQAFRSVGPLRVARRLGRSNRNRLVAMEWLSGDLLSERLSSPDFKVDTMALVGAGLAELHRQGAGRLAAWPPVALAGGLLELADWLGFLCPHLAARSHAVTRMLTQRLGERTAALCPIHGDFHSAQVLLAGDTVAILDLDSAVRGDGAADLGGFVAHLEASALRGHFPREQVAPLREYLLKGYRGGFAVPSERDVDMYVGAGLLRLAPLAFRERVSNWPQHAETLLNRIESILADLSRVSWRCHDVPIRTEAQALEVPVLDPFGIAQDPKMPFLAQALDPAIVQERLERQGLLARLSAEAARLKAIRVARHKLSRRCLIEYDLGWDGEGGHPMMITLTGKARARGTDETTYFLCRALRLLDFGEESADGISVPEPIGLIPEFHMWLQRKVPGVAATRLLGGGDGAELARRIAEAAHKLHQAQIPTSRRHSMADELRILRERLLALAQSRPQWTQRLERLLDACELLGATLAAPRPRGIHRDFYPDHIHLNDSRLYLLDLDLYCSGEPALDIGNFLGHMTDQALRTLGGADALADCEAALQDRFFELAGLRGRAAVQVYATLTLARHVALSARFPERSVFTERLLDLCEERLGLSTQPRSLALCGGPS